MTEHVQFLTDQADNIVTLPVKKHIGSVALLIAGIFAGASALLQVSPSRYVEGETDVEADMVWFDHPNGNFTDDSTTEEAKFWSNADLGELWCRVVLTDAAPETLLNMWMVPRSTSTL